MDIFNSLGAGLSIIAAMTLGPLFFYRFFLPWVKSGGKGSYKLSLFLIILNLAIYAYWGYWVKNEINPSIQVLLLSIPMIIGLLAELIFLLKNNFFWLQEISKVSAIVTIPYILVNLREQPGHLGSGYEPFLFISIANLFLQILLYFPTFALLKKEMPKIPIGYEMKFGKFDKYIVSPDFYKSKQYKQLKNAGLKQLTVIDVFAGLTKYGLLIFLLWLYGYIIAP